MDNEPIRLDLDLDFRKAKWKQGLVRANHDQLLELSLQILDLYFSTLQTVREQIKREFNQ